MGVQEIARGLETPNSIKANWDINPAFGGPIMRDRLWFFGAARYNVTADYVAGLYLDRNANNPNAWAYEPDASRPAYNEQRQPDTQLHMTWQAAPRHKCGFTWYEPPTAPARVARHWRTPGRPLNARTTRCNG
jgi:hypothetical protein